MEQETSSPELASAEVQDVALPTSGLDIVRGAAKAEIGHKEPYARPDVEVVLLPSRKVPVAGELWSAFGVIKNHSGQTVWIVNTKTWLTLAPDMWGNSPWAGALPALFPTKGRAVTSDEIIRIDPGCEYTVLWRIDPCQPLTLPKSGVYPRHPQPFFRILSIFRDFLLFNPGKFTIACTIHVWTVPPEVNGNGVVVNEGDSLTMNATEEIEMEASPWVLILGAVIGGVSACVLEFLTSNTAVFDIPFPLKMIGYWILRLLAATVLPAIGTVLLSRLATSDFVLAVKVKDIWGAIATGFVIQWFSGSILNTLLSQTNLGGSGTGGLGQ